MNEDKDTIETDITNLQEQLEAKIRTIETHHPALAAYLRLEKTDSMAQSTPHREKLLQNLSGDVQRLEWADSIFLKTWVGMKTLDLQKDFRMYQQVWKQLGEPGLDDGPSRPSVEEAATAKNYHTAQEKLKLAQKAAQELETGT